jgi:hypothetical protein
MRGGRFQKMIASGRFRLKDSITVATGVFGFVKGRIGMFDQSVGGEFLAAKVREPDAGAGRNLVGTEPIGRAQCLKELADDRSRHVVGGDIFQDDGGTRRR